MVNSAEKNPHGSQARLPCLDGIRACAIAMVVLCHGRGQIPVTLPPFVNTLVVNYWGLSGVELFFGLSGFLITYLLVREYTDSGRISLTDFYLRRCFRILPPLFLFLAVLIGLNLAGVLAVPWRDILAGALFFQNYNFHGSSFFDSRFVGHLWSLSTEEQFYLLWPCALAFLGPKRGAKLALALALVAPIIRVSHYFLFPQWRGEIGTMFHTTYDRFLWGCLLALWLQSPLLKRALAKLSSPGWFCSAILFYLVGNPLLDIYGGGIYSLPLGMSLRFLCVAFLIAWLGHNLDAWPARFLNVAPMRAIGVLSYSIYLWQELFTGTKEHFQHAFSDNFPLSVLATLVAACVSYFLVERPFLDLRRRLRQGVSLRGARQAAAPSLLGAPASPAPGGSAPS